MNNQVSESLAKTRGPYKAKLARLAFQSDNRPLGQQACDTAQNAKEDLKGAARRAEGNLTGDKGQQREHEQSTFEYVGQKLQDAGQYVADSAQEGAKKVGLTSDKNERRE